MPNKNLNQRYFKTINLANRKKVYDLVDKNPGCHFREIERKIKMPYGTLRHHLNFLVKKEILIEKKDKNNVRYFPKNLSSEDHEMLMLLRQSSIRKILVFLATSNECAHKEIVRFIGLSPATVNWHLGKLLDKKIVSKNKKGVYELNYERERIMRLLIVYKESFLDSLVNRAIDAWEN